MFTGIIETTGEVTRLVKEGTNLRIALKTNINDELKVDQSIAHNGVCLTVEKIADFGYEVVAVKETLEKTNIDQLKVGSIVNIERCMKLNDRLDGHIVQGHVDETAIVKEVEEVNGSWLFKFQLNNPSKLIVEKGSICINGTSLTAFDVKDDEFKVTIIPYTYKHTSFSQLKEGDAVNIEFDIIGKYIARLNS
jgi:riboflavin synthase